MVLQQLVNGLTLGSLYALIALGYTMVYGVLLMINFAHSEIFMSGAFASCLLLDSRWLKNNSPVTAVLIAILGGLVTSAIIAMAMERLAYRPLRRAGRLTPLISAIGVSIFLQNAAFPCFISDQSIARLSSGVHDSSLPGFWSRCELLAVPGGILERRAGVDDRVASVRE